MTVAFVSGRLIGYRIVQPEYQIVQPEIGTICKGKSNLDNFHKNTTNPLSYVVFWTQGSKHADMWIILEKDTLEQHPPTDTWAHTSDSYLQRRAPRNYKVSVHYINTVFIQSEMDTNEDTCTIPPSTVSPSVPYPSPSPTTSSDITTRSERVVRA